MSAPRDRDALPRLGAVLEPIWPREPGLRLAESERLAGVILGSLLVLLVGVACAYLKGAL